MLVDTFGSNVSTGFAVQSPLSRCPDHEKMFVSILGHQNSYLYVCFFRNRQTPADYITAYIYIYIYI